MFVVTLRITKMFHVKHFATIHFHLIQMKILEKLDEIPIEIGNDK